MMPRCLPSVAISLGLMATSMMPAHADSRAHGMAGAGIANGHSSQASFLNPALLAHAEHRQAVLPSFSLELTDEDSLLNRLDEFTATWEDLQDIAADIEEGASVDPERIRDLTGKLEDRYRDLQGEAAIDGHVYSMVSWLQGDLPVSLFVRVGGDVMTGTRLDRDDPQRIRDFLTEDLAVELDSRAFVLGYLRSDFGLTSAHKLPAWGGELAIGASVMLQRLETFVYVAEIGDFEERAFDTNEHRTRAIAPNVDLGLQWQRGPWQIGLTGRHLNRREVVADTPEVRLPGAEPVLPRYKFEPLYQLGVGFEQGNLRLSLDLDLRERDYLALDRATQRNAYDEVREYQYVRLGTEWQRGAMAWQTGFRYDVNENRPAAFTIGAARELWHGLTLALNTSVNEEDALGFGGQLHFRF